MFVVSVIQRLPRLSGRVVPSWQQGPGPDGGGQVLAVPRTVMLGRLAWTPSWPNIISACAVQTLFLPLSPFLSGDFPDAIA